MCFGELARRVKLLVKSRFAAMLDVSDIRRFEDAMFTVRQFGAAAGQG
jgi:hypothetical protein